jgi:hypothetical protein
MEDKKQKKKELPDKFDLVFHMEDMERERRWLSREKRILANLENNGGIGTEEYRRRAMVMDCMRASISRLREEIKKIESELDREEIVKATRWFEEWRRKADEEEVSKAIGALVELSNHIFFRSCFSQYVN